MARFFSKNAQWEYSRHLLPFLYATGGTLHLSLGHCFTLAVGWAHLLYFTVCYVYGDAVCVSFICKANKYSLVRQTHQWYPSCFPILYFVYVRCNPSASSAPIVLFEIKMPHTHTHAAPFSYHILMVEKKSFAELLLLKSVYENIHVFFMLTTIV